jgi:hypothetical protein
MNRRVLGSLLRFRDRQRLLRVLTLQVGYAIETFSYEPIDRGLRPPERSLIQSITLAIDLSVAWGRRPLRVFSAFCLVASLANLAYAAYAIVIYLFKNQVAEGWTTLSLEISLMFFLLFVLLAVLSEYIGHILVEVKDRPLYHVAEEHTSLIAIPNADRRNVVSATADPQRSEPARVE